MPEGLLPQIDDWPKPRGSRREARRDIASKRRRTGKSSAETVSAAGVAEADDEFDEQEWIAWASWTFCPRCGRR
eukprot:7906816-Karenia_brevis.AAC.1